MLGTISRFFAVSVCKFGGFWVVFFFFQIFRPYWVTTGFFHCVMWLFSLFPSGVTPLSSSWAALGAVGVGQREELWCRTCKSCACPGQRSPARASLRIRPCLWVPSQFCGCEMWPQIQPGVVLGFQISEGDWVDQFSSYCSFTAVPLHRINKKLIPADPVKLSIYSACHSLERFGIWNTAVLEGLLSALSNPFFIVADLILSSVICFSRSWTNW